MESACLYSTFQTQTHFQADVSGPKSTWVPWVSVEFNQWPRSSKLHRNKLVHLRLRSQSQWLLGKFESNVFNIWQFILLQRLYVITVEGRRVLLIILHCLTEWHHLGCSCRQRPQASLVHCSRMRNQMLDWSYFHLKAGSWQHTLYLTTGWEVFSLLVVDVPGSLCKPNQSYMQLRNRAGRCVAHHMEANNTKQFPFGFNTALVRFSVRSVKGNICESEWYVKWKVLMLKATTLLEQTSLKAWFCFNCYYYPHFWKCAFQ